VRVGKERVGKENRGRDRKEENGWKGGIRRTNVKLLPTRLCLPGILACQLHFLAFPVFSVDHDVSQLRPENRRQSYQHLNNISNRFISVQNHLRRMLKIGGDSSSS